LTIAANSSDHTVKFNHGLVKETIDYNERLSWDNAGWTVGRGGFGPYGNITSALKYWSTDQKRVILFLVS